MSDQNPVRTWLEQIRARFLLLSVVLVLIGGAVALQDGVFDGLRFALAMIGVILAHAAVNMVNELSDDKTGIDHHTERTPFSGGTGSLQQGRTTRRGVIAVTAVMSTIALAIGVYLSWRSSWLLMVFIGGGALATLFYTSHLARWALGELASGIALGSFVVLGTYYCMAATLTPAVIWLSIPPGILTALLLLLNEFPDVEADRRGGRRHLVIVLGYRGAAILYAVALAASYLVLVVGVALRWFPLTVLLALLTLPLAAKATVGALTHGARAEIDKLVPAMGANVLVVLATDLLIAVAYFISRAIA